MANGYTSVASGSIAKLLGSALIRGATSRGASKIGHLAPENKLKSLQGLALVGLGFAVQALGTLLQLFL